MLKEVLYMKNEKEILKLLSLRNRYILMKELDSESKNKFMRSLVEAYESIMFVDKEVYYNTIKNDLEDYKYHYENK